MQGQRNLIAMRKAGYAPKTVFVNDYPCQTDWFEKDLAATISTAGDQIELLDFRFLVGLTVSISSPTKQRAKALYEAVQKSGAARVGACQTTQHANPLLSDGWVAIFHKETNTEIFNG